MNFLYDPLILMSVIALNAAAPAGLPAANPAPTDSPPTGVEMLLLRGGIPAVFDPRFVSAGEAALPDSAWILGIAINGEAHAYSLNLLNGHEVVNDGIGGNPIAAVW